METLKVEIQELKNTVNFKFTGDIKGLDAFDVKMELKKYAYKNKTLCLDLTEVNEISLTGLNAILMSKAYASAQNNEVILLVNQDSKVLNYLHITKMTDQFKVSLKAQQILAA